MNLALIVPFAYRRAERTSLRPSLGIRVARAWVRYFEYSPELGSHLPPPFAPEAPLSPLFLADRSNEGLKRP